MHQNLHIGVIGVGRLGGAYARYFASRISSAKLVAISDVNESAASSVAEELNVAKSYHRYQDLLADKEVEAVVIVSPTSTHKEIALAAANHRKAIFCEKPLSMWCRANLPQ